MLLGLACGLVVISASTTVSAAVNYVKAVLFPVQVSVNDADQHIPTGSEIINYNDQTYVPLRFIAEKLGARIGYQQGKNYTDTKITIDLNNASNNWSLTGLAPPGNHVDTPISLKLNYNSGDDGSIQIGAALYNVGKDIITINKPFTLKVSISKSGTNETIWGGEIKSEQLTIPGADTKLFWGLQSPYVIWDGKNASGQKVDPGNYSLVLSEPVTIDYSLLGSEDVRQQQIKGNNSNLAIITLPTK